MTDAGKFSLTAALLERIEHFQPAPLEVHEVGTVVEVGDGIARVSGLASVRMSEIVEFGCEVLGVVLNLETEQVSVIVLGDYQHIEVGQVVRGTGRIVSVPVGEALLGRVVDALGRPIDGKGPIVPAACYPVERAAPGIIQRQNVDTPVQTGVKVIDAMIPIGRGQRELIIGDRQTGKTAIAVDTIINQRDKGLLCVYVAIGQKRAQVARVVATLEEYGALEHTAVVVASASDQAALQYIAPYAGCAVGEYFRDQGLDALVIYDDLTKHAWAYREISLLLRRPPSREAYPGDIFYLHSRLLERAARMSGAYKGGSLTALPIVETQLGDLAAYVPTNVISITDGQIYLETGLFNAGIRPAINVGTSVSRVGGDAQRPVMKQVAGRLRLDMAQYNELAAFAQFGAELDRPTRQRLERGQRLTDVLIQLQYEPLPLAQQVMIIYAALNGYLDPLPVAQIAAFERTLRRYMQDKRPEVLRAIESASQLTPELEAMMQDAIRRFSATSWDFGPDNGNGYADEDEDEDI